MHVWRVQPVGTAEVLRELVEPFALGAGKTRDVTPHPLRADVADREEFDVGGETGAFGLVESAVVGSALHELRP